MKAYGLVILLVGLVSIFGCSSNKQSRKIATDETMVIGGDAVDEALKKFEMQSYFANFHAHHFMPDHGDGGTDAFNTEEALNTEEDDDDFLHDHSPGVINSRSLASEGSRDPSIKFPKSKKGYQDDGVPFRDQVDLTLDDVVKENLKLEGVATDAQDLEQRRGEKIAQGDLNYFELACRYGTSEGGLDIMFITPHTKKADPGPDSKQQDTVPSEFESRRKLLGKINAGFKGSRFCGLGQESSSISAGNHLGVFGTNLIDGKGANPVYFEAGNFDQGFKIIGDRVKNGERIFLQMNHPEVRGDLGVSVSEDKANMNDYGLDDFAPMGCFVAPFQIKRIEKAIAEMERQNSNPKSKKKVDTSNHQALLKKYTDFRAENCKGELENIESISNKTLRDTYANINATLGNSFRFVETFTPKGATSNDTSNFSRSHNRTDKRVLVSDLAEWDARENERIFFAKKKKVKYEQDIAAWTKAVAEWEAGPKNTKKPRKPEKPKESQIDDTPRTASAIKKQNEMDRMRLNGPFGHAFFVTQKDGKKSQQANMANLLSGTYDYLFYLNMGFKIAPTSNQDNHLANWGTATANRTGLIAKDLTENSIMDAVDHRHVYASEDKNAKVVFYADPTTEKDKPHLMGESFDTTAPYMTLKIAYRDPSEEDALAGLRIYRYKSGEELPWVVNQGEVESGKFRNPKLPDDPYKVVRFLNIKPIQQDGVTYKDSYYAENPKGAPLRNSKFLTYWTSDEDPKLTSGGEIYVRVQLEEGEQFFVAEITQKKDFDRIYTAPIWVTRK